MVRNSVRMLAVLAAIVWGLCAGALADGRVLVADCTGGGDCISVTAAVEAAQDGDVVLGLRLPHLENGDVISFRYDDGVLVKRLIAQGGDWVELDPDGYVFVNGTRLQEPYVALLSRGSGDVAFPLTVPDGTCFVLGDNRAVSVDSRSSTLGCIEEGAVLGRLLWRVWPLDRFGLIR